MTLKLEVGKKYVDGEGKVGVCVYDKRPSSYSHLIYFESGDDTNAYSVYGEGFNESDIVKEYKELREFTLYKTKESEYWLVSNKQGGLQNLTEIREMVKVREVE